MPCMLRALAPAFLCLCAPATYPAPAQPVVSDQTSTDTSTGTDSPIAVSNLQFNLGD